MDPLYSINIVGVQISSNLFGKFILIKLLNLPLRNFVSYFSVINIFYQNSYSSYVKESFVPSYNIALTSGVAKAILLSLSITKTFSLSAVW